MACAIGNRKNGDAVTHGDAFPMDPVGSVYVGVGGCMWIPLSKENGAPNVTCVTIARMLIEAISQWWHADLQQLANRGENISRDENDSSRGE